MKYIAIIYTTLLCIYGGRPEHDFGHPLVWITETVVLTSMNDNDYHNL